MKCLYLFQTDLPTIKYQLPVGSEYIVLCWSKEFTSTDKNAFHFPNSTWMEGRNELYRRALLKGNYDYYFFLDDDLSIPSRQLKTEAYKVLLRRVKETMRAFEFRETWRFLKDIQTNNFDTEAEWFTALEQTIAKYHPKIATCTSATHPWDIYNRTSNEVECVTLGDHGCLAIHADAAAQLFPYDTKHSKHNWWAASEDFHKRSQILFPKEMIRVNQLTWYNAQHKAYPRDTSNWVLQKNTVTPLEQRPNTFKRQYPSVADKNKSETSWSNTAVVLTTIQSPTEAVKMLSRGCIEQGARMIAVGDKKSPQEWSQGRVEYYSVEKQRATNFILAKELPLNNYARKNLSYLLAVASGANNLIETDDDNIPLADFWSSRSLEVTAQGVASQGWINAYSHFSRAHIWPRGFPLELIQQQRYTLTEAQLVHAPVQQGLAHGDPDVDAVYRMLYNEALYFSENTPLYLRENQWCPFNSQNTLWDLTSVAELLYLPVTCTMRETDILRSYVAQRVLWSLGHGVLFHKATVLQDRNVHNLLNDYTLEANLYLKSAKIATELSALTLQQGSEYIHDNLRICYERLIALGLVQATELSLLDKWFVDLRTAREGAQGYLKTKKSAVNT